MDTENTEKDFLKSSLHQEFLLHDLVRTLRGDFLPMDEIA